MILIAGCDASCVCVRMAAYVYGATRGPAAHGHCPPMLEQPATIIASLMVLTATIRPCRLHCPTTDAFENPSVVQICDGSAVILFRMAARLSGTPYRAFNPCTNSTHFCQASIAGGHDRQDPFTRKTYLAVNRRNHTPTQTGRAIGM